MKKIKEFIMQDIGWKILSVLIAIGLWFVVINIQNPIETKNFSVPVTFINQNVLIDRGFVLTNSQDYENQKVSIKVRGQRLSLDRLAQNSSKIEAVVDFSKISLSNVTGADIKVYIDVTLPLNTNGDSFEILSKSPEYIYIAVDNVISIEKDIDVTITGDAGSGYVLGDTQVNPNTVLVSGAAADVRRVATIKVNVAIDNAIKDVSVKATPIAFDSENNVISNVSFNPKEVSINVPISKSKKIPIKAVTQGLPSEGYILESIKWEPEFIEVVGNDQVLTELGEITLPVVNIQNKTTSSEETYNMNSLLPAGVTIKGGTSETVKVKISIDKEAERVMNISNGQISLEGNIGDNKKATFRPQSVIITVKGPKEVLSKMVESQITGTVNVDGLEVGEHNVEIKFGLPQGTEILGGMPMIAVTITEESVVPEQPSTPSELPETLPETPTDDSINIES